MKEKVERNAVEYVHYNDILKDGSKKVMSKVWEQFHRILDIVLNVVALNYVYCVVCKSIVKFNGKTTTGLIYHQKKCNSNQNDAQNGRSDIKFNSDDLLPLRDAAAKFVCLDYRPAYGTQGKGNKILNAKQQYY